MKNLLFLFFASALLIPTFASALTLNLDYPKFGPFDLNTNQNLSEIIAYFYYLIVGIAGLAAFVMLVWGGVQWLTSGAIPSQAGEARDKIRNAILGLLLVLASFLIIQVINPELTILSGAPYPPIDCSTLGGACDPLIGTAADGTTSASLPKTNATKDGVYLCKEANCKCKDSNNCIGGSNPSSADFLFLDPAILGVADFNNQTPGMSSLGDWNDKVKSVAVKGDYGVLLADDPSYAGVVTCFDNRSGGNLHEFERIRNPRDPKTPFQRWDENGAQSAKILKGKWCLAPGITLAQELHFWTRDDIPGQVVYFFEVLEQGKNKDAELRYKVPIAYCSYLGFCGGPTEANPLLIPGPAVSEVLSLHVVPRVAAFLYQNSPATSSLTMCFKNPVGDLGSFRWDANDATSTISKEITWIEGIGSDVCTEEGVPQ